MNFSFSEVKTSIDKSTFFERNMQILHTEVVHGNRYNMLESIQQEEDEDNDTLFRHGTQSKGGDPDKVQYESDDDFTSPKLPTGSRRSSPV